MTNKFSSNILKSVVGRERAAFAFQSISMGAIPKSDSFGAYHAPIQEKVASAAIIAKAQSFNEFGTFFKDRLRKITNKLARGEHKKETNKDEGGAKGVDAYVVESSDSADSFEETKEAALMDEE